VNLGATGKQVVVKLTGADPLSTFSRTSPKRSSMSCTRCSKPSPLGRVALLPSAGARWKNTRQLGFVCRSSAV
jgi:hypothetical protein